MTLGRQNLNDGRKPDLKITEVCGKGKAMKIKKWMACFLAAAFVLGMLCTPAFAVDETGGGDPSGSGNVTGDGTGDPSGLGSAAGDGTGDPSGSGNVTGDGTGDLSGSGSAAGDGTGDLSGLGNTTGDGTGDPSGSGSADGDGAGGPAGLNNTDDEDTGESGELSGMDADGNAAGEISHDLSTDGPLVIEKDGTYRVTQSNSAATGNNITINAGVNATVILAGVNIRSGCAFQIADNSTGNVTVELAAGTTNTLASTALWVAGLQKNGGSGMLTITGEGSLSVSSYDNGAAIGGGFLKSGTNITILSGTITAKGGHNGAGIGGGSSGIGSNIYIKGGTVTAIGGYDAVGIGGGSGAMGTNIVISGGTVTATGGKNGAGIGGSRDDGQYITISGGTVTATGGEGAAGIGGGSYNSDGKNITISGGTVTAIGGKNGAGIGGGNGGDGYNITVGSGAKVSAVGGEYGSGIGGGYQGDGHDITIENIANVQTVGIGGGFGGKAYNIKIEGSYNDLHDHDAVQNTLLTEDGGLEYWYCEECGKYFADEDLTQEITLPVSTNEAASSGAEENAVETERQKAPKTGDESGIVLWVFLTLAAGAVLAAAAVSARKRTGTR